MPEFVAIKEFRDEIFVCFGASEIFPSPSFLFIAIAFPNLSVAAATPADFDINGLTGLEFRALLTGGEKPGD